MARTRVPLRVPLRVLLRIPLRVCERDRLRVRLATHIRPIASHHITSQPGVRNDYNHFLLLSRMSTHVTKH